MPDPITPPFPLPMVPCPCKLDVKAMRSERRALGANGEASLALTAPTAASGFARCGASIQKIPSTALGAPCSRWPRCSSLPRADRDLFVRRLQRSSACRGVSIVLCLPVGLPAGCRQRASPFEAKAAADPLPKSMSAGAWHRPGVGLIPRVVAEAVQSLADAGCKPAGGVWCGSVPSGAARRALSFDF